eukprot:COSAG01_NODE_38071_length_494_cov_4.756962_1_plen_45_part_10
MLARLARIMHTSGQAISRRTQERSKFCCLLFCCCSHNDFLWPSTF